MGCTASRLTRASDQGVEYVEHVLDSRWTLGKELGKGAFGRVVLGTNKTIADKFAAIKIMSKQAMKEEDIAAVRREIEIMRKLQHPNIVKFYDFFDEDGRFFVVLEYLRGGELFARIQKKEVYSEKDARDLVFILLSALKYMHDLDIVHRDLKPENLLMASESDADVKIADFGFATYAKGDTLTETCGSPAYVAPEVLQGGPYGKPADMWSLGVITYILLGGYAPFDSQQLDPSNAKMFRRIKECTYEFDEEYWGEVSSEARGLIQQLLVLDTSKRLTVNQALDHAWVRAATSDLEVRKLQKQLSNFKAFNGRRKLKGAAQAVIAINRVKRFSASFAAKREEELLSGAGNRNPVVESPGPSYDRSDLVIET